MVNKKGWLRIVEAFLAAVLIIAAMTIFFIPDKKINSENDYIKDLLRTVLKEISEKEQLRTLALEKNESGLKREITKLFSEYYMFEIRICNLTEDYCIYDGEYPQKDVYVEDRIISGNLNLYNPVKVRIFLWEKD